MTFEPTQAPKPTATTETLLGYRVEPNPEWNRTGRVHLAYFLHGPRGACYGLVRNAHNPSMLHLWNTKGFSQATAKGYTWFREDGENLVPVN